MIRLKYPFTWTYLSWFLLVFHAVLLDVFTVKYLTWFLLVFGCSISRVFLDVLMLNVAHIQGGVQGMVSVHATCSQMLRKLLRSAVEWCGHGVNRWSFGAICRTSGSVHGMLDFPSITLEPVRIFKSVGYFAGFVEFGCFGSLRNTILHLLASFSLFSWHFVINECSW